MSLLIPQYSPHKSNKRLQTLPLPCLGCLMAYPVEACFGSRHPHLLFAQYKSQVDLVLDHEGNVQVFLVTSFLGIKGILKPLCPDISISL